MEHADCCNCSLRVDSLNQRCSSGVVRLLQFLIQYQEPLAVASCGAGSYLKDVDVEISC